MKSNYYFKKQRTGLMVVGGLMTLMIAFTFTNTFSALVAQITNSVNTATTGSLQMTETNKDGTVTCKSTDGNTSNNATCATINKYGGTDTPLLPGGSKVTEINIQNSGSIKASAFTVAAGVCTSSNVAGAAFSGTGDLCGKVNVKIESGSSTIFNGTATAFNTSGAINILQKLNKTEVNASETIPVKFTVSLPVDADNTFQGKQISQPIVWQFNA